MCGDVQVLWDARGVRGQLKESVCSFRHVGPGGSDSGHWALAARGFTWWSQIISLGFILQFTLTIFVSQLMSLQYWSLVQLDKPSPFFLLFFMHAVFVVVCSVCLPHRSAVCLIELSECMEVRRYPSAFSPIPFLTDQQLWAYAHTQNTCTEPCRIECILSKAYLLD